MKILGERRKQKLKLGKGKHRQILHEGLLSGQSKKKQ